MNNLKIFRKAKNMSQSQLAALMHVGNSTVCRWEMGQTAPSLGQFLKICVLLECSPAQLLGVSSDDENNILIPVLDIENRKISTEKVSVKSSMTGCHFALVFPYKIDNRFEKGDICFFSFSDTAQEGEVVITVDEDYKEKLHIFKEYADEMQIIATGKFIHCAI